jgi:HEAT repeat protein
MIDYDMLVNELGIEHRAKAAMGRLMEAGSAATPAVRRGLKHPEARVRIGCCDVLDHFLDPEAVPELMANLRHSDAGVRARALHALACDRCKEGECRPAEAEVIPAAIQLLTTDENRYVRKSAVEALGPAVHRRRDALEALLVAHDKDADPLVRKVAGWYCPGGPIYRRLTPRSPRSRHGPR